MTIEKIKTMGMNFWDMFSEKIRLKKEELQKTDDKEELLALISEAKENVMIARNNFNFATDDKLLEYRIFELKAAESRLGYFIKIAKEKNLTNAAFEFKTSEERGACL